MFRVDPVRRMSVEDYLELEETSAVKHEYVAGEVFAMSGVTTRHNLINLNLSRLLHAATRRRGCRVFGMDVKLRAAADRIYYPDAIVACGKAAEVDLIVELPTVVVEITSPSTRATDRREKRDAYQRIPSLRTYVIVEQRRRQVTLYTRDADGEWERNELTGSGDVVIPAIDATLTLDEIYEDVPLPPLVIGEDETEAYDLLDDPDEL
jgi:Uma2 family endonuclease